MRREERFHRIGGSAILLLLLACATTQGPKIRTGPAPAAEELMAVLRQRQTVLQRLNLETRTTSWLGGQRARATVLMLVDRVGRLRFEAEVTLQGTVAALAVGGQQFALLDHQAKVFRTGLACPQNVASLIRIPLLPDEIAAILLGDAPLGEGARARAVSWDEKRGAEILEVERAEGGDAATHIWIALRRTAAGWDVIGVEGKNRASNARWRVAYEDRERAAAGPSMPNKIRFAEPGKSFDDGVEIKVNDRVMNPPLGDELFALSPPPGYTVEHVPCVPRLAPQPR